MDWAFIYLMIGLKLPLLALLWLVWWSVRAQPDLESGDEGEGGAKDRPDHPPAPHPRRPRRGPHGDPATPPPPRVRTVLKGRRVRSVGGR